MEMWLNVAGVCRRCDYKIYNVNDGDSEESFVQPEIMLDQNVQIQIIIDFLVVKIQTSG